MRSRIWGAISLGAIVVLSALGCAHPNGAATGPEARYDYVTGSYIPQNVQKDGPVTNGKDNLRIINQSEIQRSGGANAEEALRNLGANH